MSKKPTQQVSAPDAPAREVAAEWVPITELKPWKDNPRKNDGEPVRKVAESIKRFGFSSPIIARANGEIIAGHTRWKAAQSLKLDRVPVRFLDLEPDDAHLLAIADNRTAQEAEWDDDILKAVLGQLESQGADLAATGFDAKELEKLLNDINDDQDASPQIGDALKYQIIVQCNDEVHQAELIERLEADGLRCTPMMT
jgi:ParB-like chromosome segregation protein Spo0J